MKGISISRCGLRPWTLAFLVLCSSCANLTAIQSFAASSAKTAEYTEVVDAYVDQPRALFRYWYSSAEDPAEREKAKELDEEIVERQRQEREAQRARLLALHQAVTEYMNALGRLAADEAIQYDQEYAALEKAVGDPAFAERARDAGAVAGIAKLLIQAATQGYQRRQLRKVIGQAQAPLQDVLGALGEITGDVLEELALVEGQMEKYYLHAERTAPRDEAAFAAAVLASLKERDASRLKRKRDAANAYSNALGEIEKGHTALYNQRDKLNRDALLREVQRYAVEIRSQIDVIRRSEGFAP